MSVRKFDDVDCENCGCYGTSGFYCEDCVNKKVKEALSESVSLRWLKTEIEKHNNKEIKVPTYWSRAINQTAFIAGVNYEFEELKKDLLLAASQEMKKK